MQQEQEDIAQHHLSDTRKRRKYLMSWKTSQRSSQEWWQFSAKRQKQETQRKHPGANCIKESTQTAGETKQQKREGESQISHFWHWGDVSWAKASTVTHPQGITLGSNHIQWSSRQGNQWSKPGPFLHIQEGVSGWICIATVLYMRWGNKPRASFHLQVHEDVFPRPGDPAVLQLGFFWLCFAFTKRKNKG